MQTGLVGQLDFIHFVSGLFLLLLSIVAYSVARSARETGLAWRWLSLFLITHGISSWFDMTALILPDTMALAAVRFATLHVSFCFLMVFGTQSLRKMGKFLPGRWVWLLLVLAPLLTLPSGLVIASDLSRYLAALPAALLAGYAFWICKITLRINRPYTKITALLLFLYAIVAGLIVIPANIFPANIINSITFYKLTSIPIQSVRCLIIMAITTCLWRYFVNNRINMHFIDYQRKFSLRFAWPALVFLVAVGTGWAATEIIGNRAMGEIKKQYLKNVSLISDTLDTEEIEMIIEGNIDTDAWAYRMIDKKLYLMSLSTNSTGIDVMRRS